MKVLVVDIGGSKVKVLASGQNESRKIPSHPEMTPSEMIHKVQELVKDWDYDAVSIGFPGVVGPEGPRIEPINLGHGWVGFDYAAAFGHPVKIINDAAMQALGSYQGGRMLFLGLGTGLGSTLVAGKTILPMEIGQLPYKKGRSMEEFVNRQALKRLGKKAWRLAVNQVARILRGAFAVDYVMLGGGNAKELGPLPRGVRRGDNDHAFVGGLRLWGVETVPTQSPEGESPPPSPPEEWRVV